MDRRTWLSLCAGVFSTGCLGFMGPPKKNIGWIRFENNRDEAHTVDVSIEGDNKEVFNETYQLGTTPDQATLKVDNPVEEPGRYSLYFDIGTEEVHLHPSEFAEANISERCLGIRYTLHEQGTSGFKFEPTKQC